MIIRLGYVAISNKLGKKVTSSSSVTFTNYSKIVSEEDKFEKLKKVTLSNLQDLETILKYNVENNIHFYRLTSALIPLATHPEVPYWGYRKLFEDDFEYIGKIINESNMRVDLHPDQFNVINSTNPTVVENTKNTLLKQIELLKDIDCPDGKLVIHIGSATGGKEAGLKRFIDNYTDFPEEIKSRLIIENDDKTYTAKETLWLCNELSIPMVLDVHHHVCNNNGENIEEMLEDIFNTWNNEHMPPKIHFSSPREGEKDKKHADYICANDFIAFIEKSKSINRNFDVMLECKEKDIALFKLVEDIKKIKPEYIWKDESTLEVT